jgi:hypothetical protein
MKQLTDKFFADSGLDIKSKLSEKLFHDLLIEYSDITKGNRDDNMEKLIEDNLFKKFVMNRISSMK